MKVLLTKIFEIYNKLSQNFIKVMKGIILPISILNSESSNFLSNFYGVSTKHLQE